MTNLDSRITNTFFDILFMNMAVLLVLSILCGLLPFSNAVELTFELPDSAKECFHEIIQEGTSSTVEFQVR